MRYITIQHLVDAVCFTGDNIKEIEDFSGCEIRYGMMQNEVLIMPNGTQQALGINDFVVKSLEDGRISLLGPRSFRKMYREAQAHEA